MRLSLGQHLAQVQTMKLAPRMIQSMEILQLPVMALQERIEQEMNDNPLLEVLEEDPAVPEQAEERENPDAPTEDEKELVVDGEHNNVEDFERLVNLNQDWPDQFDERPRPSATRMEEEGDRKHDAMANVVDRPLSLHDHLLHQLGELELDEALRGMAVRIVSSLDPEDGGYLRSSLDDLLPPDASAEDRARAERALEVVQQLDPPGIAARDLRECLLTQLTPGMPCYEELKTLISAHLEDLRDNRLPAISRATGYSIATIQTVWEQLRKLNPKPAAAFADRVVPTVTPDVSVDRDDEGRYVVKLEDDRIPRLYISEYYRRRLASGEATNDEKEFIKRKLNAAQWLIESIEQRRSTLLRVSQAIVDHQTSFLDLGPEHIETLKMQQIADKVGVHVTTVSRAVDDKWIQTPRGIFPLKRFFVGGTVSADGEEVAWDIIRIKLQELVDKEDKQHPYSDDDIVRKMQEQGLKVARRTVTKYRQKLGIPSSRQRRDWTAS
jgi:RNA polymerase sigma-54 factor